MAFFAFAPLWGAAKSQAGGATSWGTGRMSDREPFLGVARSLTGRRWLGPAPDVDRAALALAQQTGLPPLLSTILARQGVAPQEAETFLGPTLRDLMPDPSTLKDMDRAVAIFASAVRARSRIAIFADYDVDGAASAALLINWLREAGLDPTLYIPDRLAEGYGPNVPAMTSLAASSDLIICVDCGTVAHEPIAAAREGGAEVIVIDHHQANETLPEAAIVNPNRQDEDSPLTHLCAAGLVFMFLVAVNRVRRAGGDSQPDLMGALDLVALATVADVARLTGLNRAFVRQGLKVMAGRGRPGLRALGDVAGLKSAPNAYHLGFLLGPRINAGGRIGAADLGTRLLTTRDTGEAERLAAELDHLNRERRDIEAQVLAAAREQAEERGFDRALVWASGEGWHPGVVGIVASRLKDIANRPAVVMGVAGGRANGSGRSVPGIDLGRSVAQCMIEGSLIKGGGHPMAAGLTLEEGQIDAAMARLDALLTQQGADRIGPRDMNVIGSLDPAGASVEMIEQLEAAGPFGAGNPAPRIAFAGVQIAFTKPVGTNHLSLTLKSPATGATLSAIAFGALDTELGPALQAHNGAPFHVAGRVEVDDYSGRRRTKLQIEDASGV